jgi:hypothetical protein
VYRSLKLKTTPMEDDLKILNVEYLRNHWSDLIQILNFVGGQYVLGVKSDGGI